MLILVIILAWLLANTWISLIMCQIDGGGVANNWFELGCFACACILSPFVWLGILAIVRKIKKIKS